MEELFHKFEPKAWFETSVNPFVPHANEIQVSGSISAGDNFVNNELAKLNLH